MCADMFYNEANKRTSERRKFLRINANFVVSYYIYPSERNKSDMTLTRNLSLGGICFTTDRNFDLDTILHISLKLPKINRLIVFLGRVVYTKKLKKGLSLYDTGIKFVEANENDLFMLQGVIKECASAGKKIYFEIEERRKK